MEGWERPFCLSFGRVAEELVHLKLKNNSSTYPLDTRPPKSRSLPGLVVVFPLAEESVLTLWASWWVEDESLLLLLDVFLSDDDDVMADALTPGCCITRFLSLDGHLLNIARNSTVNSSNISSVTDLSTYQNQSLPSLLCGIYRIQIGIV